MDAILTSSPARGQTRAPLELVRLVGVHKHYGSGAHGVHALHDINLQVNAGEIIAIYGPSGNGKTSLLNIVGMLDSPSSGSAVIGSLLVSKLSEQARADLRCEMIGYVFQSFSLIPVMTALENVLLPLMLRSRMSKGELAAKSALANDLLAQLGLATQASHYPPRLDASQSQRVAIARALVTQPRLVIADEPTSRLDSGCIRTVMDLFSRYQRDHGTAFLISTRDQRQLSRVTRTLQLNDGRLLGNTADNGRQSLRAKR